MVTAAKVAFGLHTPHQSLLVSKNKVQNSTSHHHLEKEVIINALQKLPGLLMPSYVVPSIVRESMKSSMRTQLFLYTYGPIQLVFLVRQCAADHQLATCPCPYLNPHP